MGIHFFWQVVEKHEITDTIRPMIAVMMSLNETYPVPVHVINIMVLICGSCESSLCSKIPYFLQLLVYID